jgi:hypothetical protein
MAEFWGKWQVGLGAGLRLYLRQPSTLMFVPDSSALTPRQRRAVTALLRGPATAVAGLARRFAAEGHELALVGGSVRDVFLGRRHGDLDLATGARPGEVRKIAAGWADTIWDTGIEFGTVGLRKGSLVCEITTYRSEEYRPESALEEQRNGEWRYLEFLQVTSLITAGIFVREIPGGTRARHGSRPVDLPEHRY